MEKKIPLIEKYRVERFDDIVGQDIAVQEVKNFFKTFPRQKALIFNGPVGTGKTSMAIALAHEYNYELFELNASDLRNRASLDEVLKPSLEQSSLFKKGKVILMDEADGITTTDRGGLPELIALLSKTHYPIIITANDIWHKKFSLLRQKCKIVNFKELSESDIKFILIKVLHAENKRISLETLTLIAKQSRGDVRAALNDLQSVLDIGEELFAQEISEREKQESIFNILKKLFQRPFDSNTIKLFDSTGMELDEVLLWVEENIPEAYQGEFIARAYDALSKADIFRGRIYRQQYWRFLVYENFFLSAGISASSKFKNITKFIQYKRPSRILKIFLANQKNQRKKAIVEKYARLCHVSKRKAMKESFLLPFILEQMDPKTKKSMDLEDKDEEFLQEKKAAIIVAAGLNQFR
ncbi:replication factor C large subunit [Candidatus Pacearchaeota archaeon]|nr:replication factor C large subunit [Candidatus Pacearchaeota archaeon]